MLRREREEAKLGEVGSGRGVVCHCQVELEVDTRVQRLREVTLWHRRGGQTIDSACGMLDFGGRRVRFTPELASVDVEARRWLMHVPIDRHASCGFLSMN